MNVQPGVILASLAAVISNVGLNLQKLTHIRIKDESDEVKKHYFNNPIWMLGLVLIILGSVADFAALAFGSQSIIAPLGSLTLVSNVFFAPCLLGETITSRDLQATFAIVFGATLSVVFASHKDTIFTVQELFGFYARPRFGVYAISVCVVVGALWVAIKYLEQIRISDETGERYLPVMPYHRFCYAAISGVIGAQSVLFAKCSAELMANMFLGNGFVFSFYQFWLVAVSMTTTIFLQLKWLNQGLQRFDALYIVPVFQTFWILVSVVAGLVFFGEYRDMTMGQVMLFPMGILFTLTGVYFLSLRGVDDGGYHQEFLQEKSRKRARAQATGSAPSSSVEVGGQLPTEADLFDPRNDADIETEPLLSDPVEQLHATSNFLRIDSTVGFMGTGSPAGFLPSRAMTLSSTLRAQSPETQQRTYFEDGL